ncbi:MAG: hypothetical protein ABEK12_01445, partial [Candidatus Nanohaloarchaea archaeon]
MVLDGDKAGEPAGLARTEAAGRGQTSGIQYIGCEPDIGRGSSFGARTRFNGPDQTVFFRFRSAARFHVR